MDPARLPGLLRRRPEQAYVDGLAAEGLDVPLRTVRRGMVCSSLGPRTLPGAFPLEHLDGPSTDPSSARSCAGGRRSARFVRRPGAGC